jgi:hypothetical protein
MKRFEKCDRTHGWFTDQAIEGLRVKVVARLMQRVESFCELSIEALVAAELNDPSHSATNEEMQFDWYYRYMSLPDLVMTKSDFALANTLTADLQRDKREREPRQVKETRQSTIKTKVLLPCLQQYFPPWPH